MARKKKHPEHVNLERYLISYADFITLLFATFVVLYALSQVDISGFKKLEDSMKQAFSAPSLMQGSDGLMSDTSDSLFDSSAGESLVTPLMMEYMNQKYEEQSYNEIEKNINDLKKAGELEGITTEKTERGLLIRFDDAYLFDSGSASLKPHAKEKLDKVGAAIGKKFILHYMRIEGHTDNIPLKSSLYPSNWELSAARASTLIRYYINRFDFLPSLFTAVGFAETRPLVDNKTEKNRAKNRRVEILILKNKYKSQENAQDDIMKMDKQQQESMQIQRMNTINRIQSISEAAKKLTAGNKEAENDAIILNQVYDKELKRLSKTTDAMDSNTKNKITGEGKWLNNPNTKQGEFGNSLNQQFGKKNND